MQRTTQSRTSLKTSTTGDTRTIRKDVTLSIRKNKRLEVQMKRRVASVASSSKEDPYEILEKLPEMTEAVLSGKRADALDALRMFRVLSSCEDNPFIQDIVDCNVIERFITFLKYDSFTKLQYESVWILSNIASRETQYVDMLVNAGILPRLLHLLDSKEDEVVGQTVWCVSNIVGDGVKSRDICIENSIYAKILVIIQNTKDKLTLQNCAWCLRNFFMTPLPSSENILSALPLLSRMLASVDIEILRDVCDAVSKITTISRTDVFAVVVASDVPRKLVYLCQRIVNDELCDSLTEAYVACILGKFAMGTNAQTGKVVHPVILTAMRKMLSRNNTKIKFEVAFALSNMVAGTVSQICVILDSGILKDVVELIDVSDFSIKKELVWVLCNFCECASVKQLKNFLEHHKLIEKLCGVLESSDNELVLVTLKSLKKLLCLGQTYVDEAAGFKINPYRIEIERVGGLDKLEKLQYAESTKIYEKSVDILGMYFDANPIIDTICEIMPSVAEGGQSFLFSGI
mgnify:CR=1 FL=1